VEKNTELGLGFVLAVVIYVIGAVAIMARPKPAKDLDATKHFETILAAAMAYAYYVAAALLAEAEFPGFLREHLFDGLAPAALVGLLINRLPRGSPKAFPRVWPVTILVLFFLGGALVFGLIAAAAVFSSGANNFVLPVLICALFGPGIFLVPYMAMVTEEAGYKKMRFWCRFKWWFKTHKAATAVSAAVEHDTAFAEGVQGIVVEDLGHGGGQAGGGGAGPDAGQGGAAG
jgi:hypothetical protein